MLLVLSSLKSAQRRKRGSQIPCHKTTPHSGLPHAFAFSKRIWQKYGRSHRPRHGGTSTASCYGLMGVRVLRTSMRVTRHRRVAHGSGARRSSLTEKQLSDELDYYVSLLSQARFPRYALITNEYDPGRLVNSNGLNRRGQGVDAIYHVNPSLLLESVHDHRQAPELERLIEAGRIRSIEDFLNEMAAQYSR